MVNDATPEGARRVFLGVLAGAGAAACTLTNDGYQPSRLVAEANESTAADDAMAPALAAAVERDGCDRGADGAAVGVAADGNCSAALPLLEPAVSTDGPVSPETVTPVAGVAEPSQCEQGVGEFGEPQRVTGLGLAAVLYGPALSPNGLSLYFSANADTAGHLYVATRESRDSAVFSPALELASVGSTASEGTPFLAGDGLYFFSTRAGGVGDRDLWLAPQSDEGGFATPIVLQGVNSPSADLLPSLSADGLTLLFASTRPGGLGGADIYSATRASGSAPFSAVINVTELNSRDNEGRVALSSDGLRAIFASSRPGAVGSWDLWEASRPDPDAAFSTPHNLAAPNSTAAEVDVALSSDEQELFFASDRSGTSELWRSVRQGCP